MKYTFARTVDDGKIINGADINRAIESFEGKEIEIIIQKRKKKRSNDQNRLFWSYMSILGHDLGYTKEEMHDIVIIKFLPPKERVIEKTGEIIETPRGTSTLTTKEFTELLEDILNWAMTDLGSELPLPEQQIEIEL